MASNTSLGKFALSPEQEQLLALLLEEQGLQATARPTITRRTDSGPPPLSFAQERLWFLNQLESNTALYNIPMALRCRGPLNLAALERALSEIVRRHEVLRATFTSEAGQPVQRIAPARPLTLPVRVLDDLPLDARVAAILRLLGEEGQQPFDLTQGPLLRASVVRLAEQDHALLITMHHIVADGFSYSIFMRELKVLYEAFVARQPSPLPELPLQFADFAAWQRDWLHGHVLEAQLSYWTDQLANMPMILEVPADYPRPSVQSYRGTRQSMTIERGVTDALKGLSRHLGVTLFTTLLTAFKVLLYRYTGQGDIVVGSPVANRSQADVENLIGLFINTLVLRSTLADEPGFADLAGRVGAMVLEAYNHQELPFEKLVEVLQPERDRSRSPLFQVMFNFQNSLIVSQQMRDVSVTLLEQPSGLSKFDLLLDITEADSVLRVDLEYSTDLFEATTIRRMLGHYRTLLLGIIDEPEQPIVDLPILSAAERQQLLIDWNTTQALYPDSGAIHHLFEQAAAQTPEAVAVVFGKEQLRYRELNERANQLAHALQAHGVGPEVLVGVYMERSPDMLVALLGILKAGGAYVPLDPSYPTERLMLTLVDAGIAILLTQQMLRPQLPIDPVDVFCLDSDWPQIAQYPTTNPQSAVGAGNLAYVIYTSGSTGTPKGVAIAHQSTLTLLHWARVSFDAAERAAVLAVTSICFDLSVFEIFVPLSWGGTVILAQDALALPTLPAAQQVTLINTVPSAIAELLRSYQIPASVRTLNLAGEALALDLVQKVYQQTGVTRVCNLYGPTEDTTYSTWTVVERTAPLMTIGKPLTNTQAYILDRQLQPVPIGVAGTLYLAGDKLARGYYNRPDLTAERFIPNPFAEGMGDKRSAGGGLGWGMEDATPIPHPPSPIPRLYKTGDLARYRADGMIEFLGRQDHQVKLRGFRIELGEIEAVLGRHEAIDDAVVLVQGEVGANQQLVAYIVCTDGVLPTFGELRAFLSARLPGYMVPASFVPLDALPLTPNGKIDRQALAALAGPAIEPENVFVAPRNEIEQKLATIWAEILRRDGIGIHDNFFELGGHSLLATQVIARIEVAFLVSLPLHSMFEAPTIAMFADLLNGEQQQLPQAGAGASIPKISQLDAAVQIAALEQLPDDDLDTMLKDMLAE